MAEPKILIFVHGMYGSNLVNQTTGETAWLSPRSILRNFLLRTGLGSASLGTTVAWSADGSTFDRDDYVPTSPVDSFTKPWDAWRQSLDPARVDVRDYLWDWRRPLEETLVEFEEWIASQGLSCDRRAVLVSYSTGSLFSWPVVNRHPELFSGWLNVGGAIGGGNFILNDFNHGWFKGPFCLVGAETMSKLPSFYSFNAAVGEPNGASCGEYLFRDPVTDKEVEADSIDLYDFATWKRLKLGPFRDGRPTAISEEEETHLKNSLAAALRFRKAHYVREGATSFDDPAFLDHDPGAYAHIDFVHFGLSGHRTHSGWYYDGRGLAVGEGKGIMGDGDGTIMTWAWKFTVGGLPNHRIVRPSNDELVHVELMTDVRVQRTAAHMLGIKYEPAVTKDWLGRATSVPGNPASSAVLITGGARGIGRDAASYIISRGYSVLVTVRRRSQYDEMLSAAEDAGGALPYPVLLDVTRDDQVEVAAAQVRSFLDEHDKELIAVVNNAGINPEADRINEGGVAGGNVTNELSDPSIGTRVFETNVVGVGRVTKAFLPFLPRGGTIVNVGSYFGSIAGAIGLDHCYYESSKFALEGMTDNMRRSLKEEGVRVSLVKPGNIATDMNAVGEVTTEVVASDIMDAIASPRPRARYYPGKIKGYSCRFVCWMYDILPAWLVDNV